VNATDVLLEVDGLSVNYRSVPALRDVSMSVRRGEVVAVVGPNGAGKSTLLDAVMRLVGYAAGDIRLGGRSLATMQTEDVARSGVALVPEGRQIFADLSVDENLRLGLVARRRKAGLAEMLDHIYTLFPIVHEFRDRASGLLSGGQQQQLAIARALVADPDLLLLDEPSLGLAPTIIDAVFTSLDAVRGQGRTIVLVEQRAQRAIAFADRTYVLADGAIRDELLPADAADTVRLRSAYFGVGA
jgi:branched-chain amino acid transport system ATP-binding protein